MDGKVIFEVSGYQKCKIVSKHLGTFSVKGRKWKGLWIY